MPPTRPRLSRLATLCAVTLLCACSEPVPMGSAVYRHDAKAPRCEPGSRPGAAGITNHESTSKEVPFNHLRLSPAVLEELATIPALVARKWCIDENEK
ncbi:MAG: hypothetical protein M3461_21460 [Pseudomonadota bacterium]|nr:hypothetical protein [Pseudomonadota bacterium]